MANSLNKITTKSILDATVATADIAADAVTGAKIADDAVGAEHIEVLDAALQLADNVKIQAGTGNDLEVYHDGTNSIIDNNTGDLTISTTGSGDDVTINSADDINLMPQGGESGIHVLGNGGVELYHDNSKKFETVSGGVSVTGDITLTGDIEITDSNKVSLGTSDDYKLYHDGSNSYVINETGSLFIKSDSQIYLQDTSGNKMITCVDGGAIELYHAGVDSVKLSTTSTGVNVTGGIRLGGNNAANEMDDYEEGTWTITATAESGTVTLNTNVNGGAYVKVGRLVHVSVRVAISAVSSQSGYLRLSLPFATSNTGPDQSWASIFPLYTTHINLPNDAISTMGEPWQNTAYVNFMVQYDDGLWTAVNCNALDAGGSEYISFTTTYITDS